MTRIGTKRQLGTCCKPETTFDFEPSLIILAIAVGERAIRPAMQPAGQAFYRPIEGVGGMAVAGLMRVAYECRYRKVAVVCCRNIAPFKYVAALSSAMAGA